MRLIKTGISARGGKEVEHGVTPPGGGGGGGGSTGLSGKLLKFKCSEVQ